MSRWRRVLLPVQALYLAIVSPRHFGELARRHAAENHPGLLGNDPDMYQLAEEQAIRRLRGLWLHAFVLTAAAIVLGASPGFSCTISRAHSPHHGASQLST